MDIFEAKIDYTMSYFQNLEHRPLKKSRLGNVGPDVYPQDPKQKEVGRLSRSRVDLEYI